MGNSWTIKNWDEPILEFLILDELDRFLENHGLRTPFGSVYISDANGRAFALSLENVIKGDAVDFERVTSLDGTFIANKFSPGFAARLKHDRQQKKRLQAF